MTRDDILGFVELLPVGDDDPLWDLVAKFMADGVVARLGDMDAQFVLSVLCKTKMAEKPSDDLEKSPTSSDEPPVDSKSESTTKPPSSSGGGEPAPDVDDLDPDYP